MANFSWNSGPAPVKGPAVPITPFSSKSEGLKWAEQYQYESREVALPYRVLAPQTAPSTVVRFATFSSPRALGGMLSSEIPELGPYDGFRWPLLLGVHPESQRGRYFIGAPALRSKAYTSALAYENATPVFDWKTVRNCFTTIAPIRPWIMQTVLVELSPRLWELYWGAADDAVALQEFHQLTECLARVCPGKQHDEALYNAEQLLASRQDIMTWAVAV